MKMFSLIGHKKISLKWLFFYIIGGDRGDRTPGLCIANAALSQLSYIPKWVRDVIRRYFSLVKKSFFG